MVRRVRPGRRHDDERPLRWAGPPPLLILATVAALAVLPFLHSTESSDGAIREAAAEIAPRRVQAPLTQPQRVPSSQGGHVTRGVAPVQPKPAHVGVASFNMYRVLPTADARQDARAVTRRAGVDVVGWQEAQHFGGVLRSLPGWQTKTFECPGGPCELAFSWRSDEFELVSSHLYSVPLGSGDYPFSKRLVATVVLERRADGRQLTVLNTHLPHAIEDFDHDPGQWTASVSAHAARVQLRRLAQIWRQAPGRWVIGTGDFNFDARADAVHQPTGGPREVLGRTAVSSYMALGDDVAPTYPENGRQIDYVWADRDATADGRIRFAGQSVLGGLHSDHNALLTRMVLS